MFIRVLLILSFLLSASPLPSFSNTTHLQTLQDLIIKANQAYSSIDNYQAIFYQEKSKDNDKRESEYVFLRFEKPSTWYLKWNSGKYNGQQILYSKGNFEDKLLTRPAGFWFNFIPIVSMDQDDPRLLKEEARPISQSGIEHLLTKFTRDFNQALPDGLVEILSVEDVEIDSEKAKRITVQFDVPDRKFPQVSVAFSNEHHLLMEMRLYPSLESEPEIHRYLKVTPNLDRDNDAFQGVLDKRFEKYLEQIPTV